MQFRMRPCRPLRCPCKMLLPSRTPNGDVNALHQLMHWLNVHLTDDPMVQAQGAIEASVLKACGPYLHDAVQALKKRRFASFDKSPSRSTLGEPYEVKPSLGKHREKYKYLPTSSTFLIQSWQVFR
jgi:hypothetical protein